MLHECLRTGKAATSTTHAYAEMYRHLTRNIAPYNLLPEEAEAAVVDNLGKVLQIVVLDRSDYEAAIHRCVALHYQAALRAGANTIVTDNVRDFNRLIRDDEEMKVRGMRG